MHYRSFGAWRRAAAVLFVLCLLPAAQARAATLKFGEEAPRFALRDLDGTETALEELAGPARRPGSTGAVLVFFTTWCPVCREELPLIDGLAGELAKRGITVLLIGFQEDAEDLRELLRDLKVSKARTLADPDGRAGKKYGVRYLPTIYGVGRDGLVKDLLIGESDDIVFDLRKMADRITAP